jgi:hypothetical protein
VPENPPVSIRRIFCGQSAKYKEFALLMKIRDNYSKYLLALDSITGDYREI